MCGRFYLDTDRKKFELIFDVHLGKIEIQPHYNITPSQSILTITQDQQGRHAQFMRWGLIPSWSKGIDSRYSMINARAESVHEKPAYKRPFKRTRCLIPASGFYEWKKEKSGKQPYCITSKDAELMTFAGLWDSWKGEDQIIQSCSIITAIAAEPIRHIHERSPVILESSVFDTWLNPNNQDLDQLRELLLQDPAIKLDSWPISTAVNKPANDFPELIAAIS